MADECWEVVVHVVDGTAPSSISKMCTCKFALNIKIILLFHLVVFFFVFYFKNGKSPLYELFSLVA